MLNRTNENQGPSIMSSLSVQCSHWTWCFYFDGQYPTWWSFHQWVPELHCYQPLSRFHGNKYGYQNAAVETFVKHKADGSNWNAVKELELACWLISSWIFGHWLKSLSSGSFLAWMPIINTVFSSWFHGFLQTCSGHVVEENRLNISSSSIWSHLLWRAPLGSWQHSAADLVFHFSLLWAKQLYYMWEWRMKDERVVVMEGHRQATWHWLLANSMQKALENQLTAHIKICLLFRRHSVAILYWGGFRNLVVNLEKICRMKLAKSLKLQSLSPSSWVCQLQTSFSIFDVKSVI